MKDSFIDLSSLQDLSLGPKWSGEKPSSNKSPKKKRHKHPARRKSFNKQIETFAPPFDVLFYPSDKPFHALTKAIRNSCKTYELFAIANLILEKPERFVVVLKAKRGEEKQFFCSTPDNIPFETEEEAVAHVMLKHIEQFFELKEIELEPPTGNFQSINKCPITGELLAPPNYHRYNEILKEHYQTHCSNLSFEDFCSKVESDKSQDAIDAWVEKMKKGTEYIQKTPKEGTEPEIFKTKEEARRHLLTHCKQKVVKAVDTVRIEGQIIDSLPKGIIQRSIEFSLDKQRKFPLETANNLRGRLRRLKFNIYKKGNKGVSFVCATKRKFRTKDTVFAETIQKLIEFIDTKPNILVSELPKAYLNIENPDSESLDEETSKNLKQLHIDLKWLIHEGFVIEYENGKLLAPPILETEKKQVDSSAPEIGTSTEENPETKPTEEKEEASVEVSKSEL